MRRLPQATPFDRLPGDDVGAHTLPCDYGMLNRPGASDVARVIDSEHAGSRVP